MRNIVLTLILFSVAIAGFSQQTPAKKQSAPVLILNATAHLGNGEVIENSAIGFVDGKITLIGDARTIKIDQTKFKQVIQASGKHVYPGFIAPDTQLGLIEVDAVRATRDDREVGVFNPNIRSIISYNTDSRVTPTIRSNGVLMAQITPKGGIIPGQSSVVQLDAWNWEDAAYKTDGGVKLMWPNSFSTSGWWANPGPTKENNKYQKGVDEIKAFFKEAQAYNQSATHEVKNLKFEAMRAIFSKEKTLFVRVNNSMGIMDVAHFAEEFGVKIVVVGGQDAYMNADFLKERNIPIILAQVQRLPNRQDADIDQPYKTPKLLHDAGIDFCFSMGGAWEQRNLVFQAGQAVSYGLDYEQAIKGLTLNAAKILGIDKTTGSLEMGKDATLFISAGDVLDMRTSKVETAFIQGRNIDVDNKQKALYRKYKEKYDSE